tara:strand:- start:5133 stop:5621 length:489 start_codon:yes stop_codon:yes gene_type:complete
MKRIIVLMLVLGSCGGVPEQVDKKGEPSAQTKSLGGSVDKGAKDVSKTTIFETPVEGKKDISKLVEKEDKIKPATFEEVNLNLLVRNIKGKKLLEIKNKLGGPKRIRTEPPGEIWQYWFPQCWALFFIKYSDGGKVITHADLLKSGKPISGVDCVVKLARNR